MIVKCINDGGYHLTPGKLYFARPLDSDELSKIETFYDNLSWSSEKAKLFRWNIVNDIGHEHHVEENLFVPIDLIRQEKLNKLGI